MSPRIRPIFRNPEKFEVENWEVDGHLLYTNDSERDLCVHMLLFGFQYRYREYNHNITVIDDYIFSDEPDNFGVITGILASGQESNTAPHIIEFARSRTIHNDKLNVLFPNLNAELYKELKSAIKEIADKEVEYLRTKHEEQMKYFEWRLIESDMKRQLEIIQRRNELDAYFDQSLSQRANNIYTNDNANRSHSGKLAEVPMVERQPSKISSFFRRLVGKSN